MLSEWGKRDKVKVRQREQQDKALGRLPYWNDRARSINWKAYNRYGCIEKVTGQQLKALYDDAGGKCLYCQLALTYSEAHFDHIQPLNGGGRNCVDNLGLSCGVCNTSKGDDDVDVFLNRVKVTHEPKAVYDRLYAAEVVAV